LRSNAFALALDRFDVPVEGDDLGFDADLFFELVGDRERGPPESICHARLNV
jgi:hypothetical protein